MTRNKIILVIAILISFNGITQQVTQYANIAYNPYIINPAASGLTDVMQFEATGRSQWTGYNGGPRTMTFMGHSQLKSKNKTLTEYNIDDESFFEAPQVTTGKVKHIVGGILVNDAIGPFAKTSIKGSYAIHLPLFKSWNFGLGLGLGWSNFRIDQSRVVLYQEDDNAYTQFLGNSSAQNMLDANAGFVIYNENAFLGFSTSQVFRNDLKFDGIETGSNFERHHFIVAKYAIDLKGDFAIEPNIVAKMIKNAPSSFDFGARFIYNKSTWLSFQYRTSNSLVFQLGSTLVKNLYVAYSYEYGTGAIQTSNNGTHEVQLGIYIGNSRNIKKELKETE